MPALTHFLKITLCFCFVAGLFQISSLHAQSFTTLPPNQPEQDACHAIQLCGNRFSTPYSYVGVGQKLDLDSTPCFPQPSGGETNSVWLQVTTVTAGNIVFTLTPVEPSDDYDFAIIKVNNGNCGSLYMKDVIRCNYNYNANLPGGGNNGIIGISDTSRTLYVPNGTIGHPYSQAVYAAAGDTYLILVNNYGIHASGSPSAGFTIDFSGSTASFYNPSVPQAEKINTTCTDGSRITVALNKEILCSSIAPDGSNFITNTPVPIVKASGVNCTDRGGYVREVELQFASPLPAGTYTLNTKKSSNGSSITDLCGNPTSDAASDAVSFIIRPGEAVAIDKQSICYQDMPYVWNGITVTAGGDGAASYTTKSATGCDSTTVLNLTVLPPPREESNTAHICDGDIYTLPWNEDVTQPGTYTHHYTNDKGCDTLVQNITLTVFTPPTGTAETRDSTIQLGFCKGGSVLLKPVNQFVSYLWNTGQTDPYIIVNIAGSYGLKATDEYGCITIDTFVVASYPRPAVLFGRTEYLCADSSKLLDAGSGFAGYFWNDGSTSQSITTTTPGTYWVRLIDKYNCDGIDTVTVVAVPRPADFLGSSVTKCSFKEITVSAPNSYTNYFWSDGDRTPDTKISTGGLYWLSVTDYHECNGRDSITIIDSVCPEYFNIPTAFTPNNDGRNDTFKPRFAGTLSNFHFAVYNRWGKLVFSSRNNATGWDGTVNGAPQSNGTYLWICTYSLNGKPPQTDKGTVTLLR